MLSSDSDKIEIVHRKSNLALERMLESALARLEKLQADNDYLAMCAGVDLEEGDDDADNDNQE